MLLFYCFFFIINIFCKNFSLTIGSNSENNSIADLQSDDREESPDILANFIHDTTRKLENLTNELNNHDNDDFKLSSTKHIEVNLKETISTDTTDSSNNVTEDLDENNYKQEINGSSTTESNDFSFATKLQQFTISQPSAIPQNRQMNSTNNKQEEFLTDDHKLQHNGVEHNSKGITIEKHSSLSLNLMQSVDLEGK